MTEKRFTYDAKQVAILKNGEFWLECAISTACNHSEICNELNNLVDENEQLKQDLNEYCNFSLHDVLDKKNKEIERLQSTLAYRSNQLALMEQLIDDLGHEEMKRQMEEILND